MTVTVEKSKLSGKVAAPPSKSMAHRLIICAALSGKKCSVSGIARSDDINATVSCLEALGVCFEFNGDKLTVDGGGLFTDRGTLDCNESGSTLRFLIPICLMSGNEITLVGKKRLFARSLDVYKELCDSRGFEFSQGENSVTLKGLLTSGVYSVRGDISSQFISGLLFVLPMLSGDSVIEITGELQSAPYIDMTIAAQKAYGVSVVREKNIISIKGGQQYMPIDTAVEGDCSNAAFFEALRCLGHDVTVTGLAKDTLQGDGVFYEYFKAVNDGTPTLNVKDCPDLAPILMALAAAKNGCTLTGTARLKIKESDRGEAMRQELEKLGVTVNVKENEITVGSGIKPPRAVIDGHNDHRIVMACAVLLTLTGGRISGAQAVNKSFPDFFERMAQLGAKVIYETE